MGGKPASRIGDKVSGGVIVQGSRTVLIGSQNGVACSICPGGVDLTGNPVNSLLGAKVLIGETDFALPGPLPFVLSRNYSSYQTDTPAPVGLFGPGWQFPSELSLNVSPEALTFNDSGGRSIHFEPLTPGEIAYSRSEGLWLVRGGTEVLDGPQSDDLAIAWQGLPVALRRQARYFFATHTPLGPWWCFGVLPDALPPLGQRLFLQGVVDRFGRRQLYTRAEDGPFAGRITGVTDGASQRYALDLIKLTGIVSHPGWGSDDGIRLAAVRLRGEGGEADIPLVTYDYTACGELAAVHGRDGKLRRQFEYHSVLAGRMTAHSYAGHPTSRYGYDAQGRVIEQTNPQGLNYRFEYHPDCTVVSDHLGRQRTYHFEGEGGLRRVVKLERADGSCTQSRFDGSGRLVASIDPLGRETTYERDTVTGNLLSVTLPDGKQQRFEYDTRHALIRALFPDGTESRNQYDALGRLIASINPLGHSNRYRYADGKSDMPCEIEDAKGGIKRLDWNAQAQLQHYSDCSGSGTHYFYDRWGQTIRIEGEEGIHLDYEYDIKGQRITSIDTLGQKTAYRYDEAGDLSGITYADGSEVRFEYDVWGDLCGYHYGGQTQRYRHDAIGRLTEITDANGARAVFHYDKMDRLIEETGFDGRVQHYRYNLAGELIQSESAGKVTEYRYDDGGRLSERLQPGISGQPIATQYVYDDSGALVEARHTTDPAGVLIWVKFEYDKLGQLIAETQEATNISGEVVWDHRVEHCYDAIGVERKTTLKGLPSLTWQTYGSGHLHGLLLDQTPLVDFERDRLHREAERRFGPTRIQRHYDPLSRLAESEIRSPLIGGQLDRRHRYDLLGQLTRIDTLQGPLEYRYDPAGRLIEALLPDGHAEKYHFDAAGNRLFPLPGVLALSDLPEIPLAACSGNRVDHDGEYRYRYDEHGNLLLKYKEGETHFYGYDGAQRLTRFARETLEGVVASNYLYDPFGRRIAKQTVQTDGQGQSQGDVETTWYGWDGDRLVLTEQNGQRVHTVYQPGSFVPLVRIAGEAKAPAPSLAQTLQHQGVPLEQEHVKILDRIEQELRQNALSAPSLRWLREARLSPEQLKSLLAEESETSPQIHLYHCDHLGTPVALIDRSGSIDWSIELDAWGKVIDEHNPRNLYQPIRFQGQHNDPETGLYYNRHRYYDPHSGRYISQDPIGFKGGLNLHQYTPNPIQRIDPLGLDWGAFVNSMPAVQQQASYAMYLAEQGVSNEEYAQRMSDFTTGRRDPGPLEGSVSVSAGASGHVIAGGGGSVGITVGKHKDQYIPRICIYIQTCQTLGPGAAGGVDLSGTLSNAGPSTGVTYSGGGFGTGGYLGEGSGSVQVNLKNPNEVSFTGGIGIGGGAAGGAMTCQQYQWCPY